jgi:hypothetical protein
MTHDYIINKYFLIKNADFTVKRHDESFHALGHTNHVCMELCSQM